MVSEASVAVQKKITASGDRVSKSSFSGLVVHSSESVCDLPAGPRSVSHDEEQKLQRYDFRVQVKRSVGPKMSPVLGESQHCNCSSAPLKLLASGWNSVGVLILFPRTPCLFHCPNSPHSLYLLNRMC